MRILAISDRSPKVKISDILKRNDIDVICTLGDLDYFDIRELASINSIPKLGVYGNHCSGNYFDDLGIKNMHLKQFEYHGLTFGGFEGSVRYKESEYAKMYTQEEATELLSTFPGVDVMLSHCPPYGINDDISEIAHSGFIALREYVKKEKPKYLLHGHTYPDQQNMINIWMETKIIYVYGDKIIELK